jgi:poly(A) polymerase
MNFNSCQSYPGDPMCDLPTARILSRSEHIISRKEIDPDALKVLYRLHRNGYLAYMVGGGVRDLMLGRKPKDYDIASSATPEQILDLFRNSRIIGRRFPIVHVMFGRGRVLEVATFRSNRTTENEAILPTDQDSREEEATLEAAADVLMTEDSDESNGNILGRSAAEPVTVASTHRPPAKSSPTPFKNKRPTGKRRRADRGRYILEFCDEQHYGSPSEDALRRDLTINGLFYNIADFSVIDHINGLEDLRSGIIRVIGDPDRRFTEDPVRMIRAVRHCARLDFRIEPVTWEGILRHRDKLKECSKARILEEFYRDLRSGAALPTLHLMKKCGILHAILPTLDDLLPPLVKGEPLPLSWERIRIMDKYVQEGEEFDPPFLLATLLTFPMLDALEQENNGTAYRQTDFGRMAYRFLKPVTAALGVARRDTERLFLISISQRRIHRCRTGESVPAFLNNKPYFAQTWRLLQLDMEAQGLEPPELKFNATRRRRGRSRRRRSRHQAD